MSRYILFKSKLILVAVALLLPVAGANYGAAQQTAAEPSGAEESFGFAPDSTPLYPALKQASLLANARKLDEAAAGYGAILERAVAAQDKPAQALAHTGLSWVLHSKAEYLTARKEGEEALLLFQSLQNAYGAARLNRHLGNIAYAMGDRANAREHYRQALSGFEALGMLRDKAAALRNLEMADAPEGDKLLQEALAIAVEIGDKDLQAAILQNQGDEFFARGEFDAAQDLYDNAERLLRGTGNQRDLSYLLTSEGRLQRAHGHPEKAILLYQEGLEIQEKIGDRRGQIQNVNAMAVAYGYLHDYAKSAQLYQKAVALAKETGSPGLVNFELGGLAGTFLSLGKNQEAAVILVESVQKDPAHADYGYSNLGVAYLRLGRPRESLEAHNKAIEIARARNNWDLLPGALRYRAEAEEKVGNSAEALTDAQEALRVIEDVRKHLVPNDFMKRGFSESTQEIYRLYVRLLEQTGQPGRALEVAEDARSRAFLDLLATRDLQLKADRKVQLASLHEEQEHLPASGIDKRSPQGVLPVGILMRGARPDATPSGVSSDPELRSLVSVQPFSLPDVQATASRLNSTVLSYWVAPDVTYIWVVSSSGVVHSAVVNVTQTRLEELVGGLGPGAIGHLSHPTGKELTKQSSQSSSQVGSRGGTILAVGTNNRNKWRELYSLLIEPVSPWLPSKQGSLLTIEPHGPLLMLPFAALADKQGRYLLEHFSLHYTPAVSLLQFTEKKKQEAEQIAPHYLLVADPSQMPRGLNNKDKDEAALPRLPGSRREVGAIARLLPEKDVTLLEGRQATEDQVSKTAGQSTVVHFATHGIIRDDQPFESFLALGGSRMDKRLDGRLTAQKIYGLDLHADLVFLSACRSGAGKTSGDGLVGLTRAFWYAGTPSVIASVWDVADEPTYRLVADFYRSRLQGADKSRALRAAQLHLLHELRAGRVAVHTSASQVTLPEDPMFWAGFVLQGEP